MLKHKMREQDDQRPDRKELREFGLVTSSLVVALFGIFFPWMLDAHYPIWPWWLGAVLTAWALAAPRTLQGVYRVWMKLGMVLNRITSPLLMGLVFYLVITPVGYCMRVFRRDPMTRSFDKTVSSYRIASRKSPRHKLERPF
jgi:Saxitoxin biosynthesis operon protein SxtJ